MHGYIDAMQDTGSKKLNGTNNLGQMLMRGKQTEGAQNLAEENTELKQIVE